MCTIFITQVRNCVMGTTPMFFKEKLENAEMIRTGPSSPQIWKFRCTLKYFREWSDNIIEKKSRKKCMRLRHFAFTIAPFTRLHIFKP